MAAVCSPGVPWVRFAEEVAGVGNLGQPPVGTSAITAHTQAICHGEDEWSPQAGSAPVEAQAWLPTARVSDCIVSLHASVWRVLGADAAPLREGRLGQARGRSCK